MKKTNVISVRLSDQDLVQIQLISAEKEWTVAHTARWLIEHALSDKFAKNKDELIYGYTPEVWNAMSEGEQLQIQNKFEYDYQHPDQADWFID